MQRSITKEAFGYIKIAEIYTGNKFTETATNYINRAIDKLKVYKIITRYKRVIQALNNAIEYLKIFAYNAALSCLRYSKDKLAQKIN